MVLQALKVYRICEVPLLDGSYTNLELPNQYCYTSGYEELDKFFGIRKLVTAGKLEVIKVGSYNCPYYLSNIITDKRNFTIPVDENSMDMIRENERKYEAMKEPYEYEDDEIFIKFIKAKYGKLIVYIKTKDYKIVSKVKLCNLDNSKGMNACVELAQLYKSRTKNIKCFTIINIDGHKIYEDGYNPLTFKEYSEYVDVNVTSVLTDGENHEIIHHADRIKDIIINGEGLQNDYNGKLGKKAH
jgi:hypothetical protein